jgi:hypothetical protein
MVAVAEARHEVSQAEYNTIAMMPEEQFAFWHALNAKPKLTNAQLNLGRVMRGEG